MLYCQTLLKKENREVFDPLLTKENILSQTTHKHHDIINCENLNDVYYSDTTIEVGDVVFGLNNWKMYQLKEVTTLEYGNKDYENNMIIIWNEVQWENKE